MKRIAIIMAGGSGERFWPLSRRKRPKQLLELSGSGKTMIEDAIDRVLPLVTMEDIFIITSETLLAPIRETLAALPPENVIAEPAKRNTAPCLALASAIAMAKYDKAGENGSGISAAVLTADHIMRPVEKFRDTVRTAFEYVETHDAIATIGIVPERPETGFGYIETGERFSADRSVAEIQPVLRFTEKPDIETAKRYVAAGNRLWNSGMFFYRLDTFNNELQAHLPEVGGAIEKMHEAYRGNTVMSLDTALPAIQDLFSALPDISIDYGLMERSGKVTVVKALFDWDDIGSFDSLDRVREKDEKGNIIQGEVSLINTSGTTVINQSSGAKMVVSAIGLEGMVIVVTDDAVMVCPKDKVQDVKKSVEDLRNRQEGKWI